MKNRGKYCTICPDKRYYFDCYDNSTRLIEIVFADTEDRNLHSVSTLLEARTHVTLNNPRYYWEGRHKNLPLGEQKFKKIRALTEEINQQPKSYIDANS